MEKPEKKVIIIGAGFAGLSAGIYSRLNGYKTDIYEMHNLPGGLCTSWNRKGYTFDACIHWLVGSSPKSGMHEFWEETGVAQGRKFIDMDEYMRFENTDGRTLILHTNIDNLKDFLLEFSPLDKIPILEFIDGIKMCLKFETPSSKDPLVKRITKQAGTIFNFIVNGKKMKDWMSTSCGSFAERFKDPMLREVFRDMWGPRFSFLFILFTFAYLHNRNAGYPLGGSMPMAKALENRYKELGGTIIYNSKVSRILTDNDKAYAIRLEDGSEHLADKIISAADGHATLFNMLEGRYGDQKTLTPYEKWPLFPSLIFVSIGVNRKFDEIPHSVSGLTYMLKEPVKIGDTVTDKLSVHLYNHDPGMAPTGKTALTIMINSDYSWWQNVKKSHADYLVKKAEIAQLIPQLLEQRFPGISSQIEVIDVATPLTFERYTGNWKGSFEGWLLTPGNADVLMKPMSQTVPGLKDFYMCGQWVEPGGGLPTAVMSAKRLVKKLCREDGIKFKNG